MKRGENHMSEEHFEFFITRLKNYRELLDNQQVYLPYERARSQLSSGESSPVRVIMCGMGESLLHARCPEWIGRIRREVGVRVSVVTNGLLLKERTVEKLAEAQVTVVLVSVPGIDKESYSRYMKIDWDLVLARVEAANKVLPGRIQINATIPDDASFTEADVVSFWESRGVPIAGINRCHNRGGFLKDHSLTGRFGVSSSHFCGIIARHNFIAWDGRVLSCCHDLHGDNVIGHVAKDEFMEIAAKKSAMIPTGPQFDICKNCNDRERSFPGQILGLPQSAPATRAEARRAEDAQSTPAPRSRLQVIYS